MAFEIEQGSAVRPDAEVSDMMLSALVQQVVVAPLVPSQNLPGDTNVKKHPIEGSLVAEDLAESTAYTYSANSELTRTSVSTTATKIAIASKLTIEAEQFNGPDRMAIARQQGAAIGRKLDDDILALFNGFSTQVTATSTLTVDDVHDAVYNVYNGLAGDAQVLKCVLDYKGANEIIKEMSGSTASLWSQPSLTSILSGAREANNGFVGSLPGVEIYQTNGLPLATSDDVALVFNPMRAFAMVASPSISSREKWFGAEGGYTELFSWIFFDVVEYQDAAGVGLLSDT